MRVFCTGFNLYGQFIKCNSECLETFIDFEYDDITNLELSHTFAIGFKQKNVFLYGAKNEKTHHIQKIEIPETFEVFQVACTDNRILFLSENGKLLKLDLRNIEEPPSHVPDLISSDVKDQIVKITSGSKINVALSQQGKLFSLPSKLNYQNKNIIDICAGREHCIILDEQGNVYSFGRGSRGQLGHGNLEDITEPKLIEGLAGIKISKIAARGWHSCAISAEGDLYMWGWNQNGQLGLFNDKEEAVAVMASPQVVDFDTQNDNLNVVQVACGNRHTVVLLDNGKLYGAGWNKYHQLGIEDDLEYFHKMTFVHDFVGLNVSDIKCGPWSSAVIIKS